MGRAIEALAPERGWRVVAVVDRARAASGLTRASLGEPDVAVEFTTAEAAPGVVRACLEAGVPIVSGTTGWDPAALDAARHHALATGGALLWSPNFATGMVAFLAIARRAAELLAAAPGFEAAVLETHHSAKRDAPSGTALTLARALAESLERDVPITSVRVGHVPGTHEIVLDGAFEQIRLAHVARDRRVFADGALTAAAWLRGRRGVFTMEDVLGFRRGADA